MFNFSPICKYLCYTARCTAIWNDVSGEMPLNTYIFSVSCKTFKICVLIIATTDSFSVFGWHSIYFFLCYDVFVFLCQKYVVFFSYSWIFPFKANITVDLVIFGFMSFLFCAFYFSSSLGFHLSYIFRVTQIFFFFS